MLDWPHKLVLRSVAKGDCDDSPALRTLVASGLVERGEDGSCMVTPAGRIALEDDASTSRIERIFWPLAAVCAVVFVVDAVVGWVA